jgi:hypothetical protein
MRTTDFLKANRLSALIIAISLALSASSCNKNAKRTADANQAAEPSQRSAADEQPVPSALPASPTPPQAQTTPAPPPPIVIPAGTLITVNLLTPVGSKISHAGDRFEASLAKPVVVHDEVVIPKGADASGRVIKAHRAGRFHGAATLDLVLDTLSIDGVPHPIHTAIFAQQSKGKGKRTAGIIGGGAAGGALIGALAGAGKGAGIGALVGAGAGTLTSAFTGKRDITLRAESRIRFRLRSKITIPETQASASE